MEGITEIINDLRTKIKASAIIVALRNGIFIEGTGVMHPSDATSAAVAMLAIVFGAAETAETNLGNEIPGSVTIASKNKDKIREDIIIGGAGPKAILIVRTQNPLTDSKWLDITNAAQKIKEVLAQAS